MGNFNLDDFRRPDGSIDYATLPDSVRAQVRREEGGMKHDRSLLDRRAPRKEIERFGIQPGAKIAPTVRDLGGDDVQPVPEEEALARMVEMQGGQRPRLLGKFDPDSPENQLPPPVEPRLLGKFDPDSEENRLPPKLPASGSFFDPAYQSKPLDPHANTLGGPAKMWPEDLESKDPRPFALRPGKNGFLPQGPGLPTIGDSPRTPGLDPSKLMLARMQADAAVGRMKGDELEHGKDADLERAQQLANGMPDRSKPKAALQRFQSLRSPSPRSSPRLQDGEGASPAPDRPQFADLPTEASPRGPASARQPLQAAQQMLTGASPDTSADEAELKDAQKSRDDQLLAAQIASQFGHYADVMQGTNTGDRGEVVRSQAGNGLADLKAKRGLRDDAREKQMAAEDRAFEREGVTQTRGIANEKAGRDRDFNDAASQKSKQARAIAVSLYPKIVARIPPAVFQGMSASDVDTFLKEAAPEKQVGAGGAGGGTGLKPSEMNALRKSLPPGLVDSYDQLQNAYGAIDRLGGWDKVKAGALGSMTPTMFMDKDQQEIRQTLSRVAGSFLSSLGGKSITNAEDKLLLGSIAGRPTDFAITPQMLQRGVGIIERAMANSARQSTAAAPQGAKDKLFGDMGIDQNWVKGGKLPLKPGQPQGGGDEMIWVTKGGVLGQIPRSKFNPQKHQPAEAP